MATMPMQLLRGPGGEERLLKSARDLCAAVAVLAADYRSLERLAHAVGDDATANLSAELRAESEQCLSECFEALDGLAEAVVSAEIRGEPVYRISRIGAVQMLRLPRLREGMYRLREQTADALHQARRGVTRVEEELRTTPPGPTVRATLPIADYDTLPVDEIRQRLAPLSQAELATIETYERQTRDRAPILEAINDLRGKEPWPGYDELNVSEIRARLRQADSDQVRKVLDYERSHKQRSSILNAPEAHVAVSAVGASGSEQTDRGGG